MLRLVLISLCFTAISAVAAPVPKSKIKDEESIQGQWKVVELTHSGQAAPAQHRLCPGAQGDPGE